jgi:hypothetical protein
LERQGTWVVILLGGILVEERMWRSVLGDGYGYVAAERECVCVDVVKYCFIGML